MSNAAGDFRKKIELLERNFHVSTVIFKKYEPIFLEIFKDPREENTKTQRLSKMSGALNTVKIRTHVNAHA